jgi:WD40 repeat protein/transcriptional regulator with XRE-family HTH domain/DNA-binding transcriptional regulator GbsR (MarR family)
MMSALSDGSGRENAFGRSCVRLRKSLGLSQRALGEMLGSSEQTVRRWERGEYLPSQAHIERLLSLALRRRAFMPGREYEEARAMWLAARQQADFHAFWTRAQLGVSTPPSTLVVLKRQFAPGNELPDRQAPAPDLPRFDWEDALDVRDFYGRQAELLQLEQWVVQERCRVVSVFGLGGIGKSSLAVTLLHQVAHDFQRVVFRSLRDAPPCRELLDDCLGVLSPQPRPNWPASFERRLDLLLEYMQAQRSLLVLDNLESLLQERDATGSFRAGYEDYDALLDRVARTPHQSCLLLTSREEPAVLEDLESRQAPVRALRLAGLEPEACMQIFEERDLTGSQQEQLRLAQAYAGNPLALKIVAEVITELFGGAIAPFLEQGEVIFSTLRSLLAEQFARLSALEQALLTWLAIAREPLTVTELQAVLVTPVSETRVGETLEALQRRSLVEQRTTTGLRGAREGQAAYALQSLVLEYVTQALVERMARQLQHGGWEDLLDYALEQAEAWEYVRQAQERLIVDPVLLRLQSASGGPEAVQELLKRLLSQLRGHDVQAQGYGPTNIITLLRRLRGHLRHLDLSSLSMRGADLQGVEMQDTRLSRARMRNPVFTEAFGAAWSVAISGSGRYWAAGSRRGEVRIWDAGSHVLHLAWQAHGDTVDRSLTFSPDERLLATGSWDRTIKLWDVQSGALLWTGWHSNLVEGLAFAPDGQRLASCGDDAVIRIWDTHTGATVETIAVESAVYAVAWSPDGIHLAGACFDGRIQVWDLRGRQTMRPAIPSQTLSGHTHWVLALAFAPDSTRLASGSWDRTVRLWDMANGRCLRTLAGHTDHVHAVAWSPDGRTLASCGFDDTIWLWDVERDAYRMALHGHTNRVYSIAFTPDSRLLLSGSEDKTLRAWDVENGRCVRIIRSYAVALYDVAWSADGAQIVCASSDELLIFWNGADLAPSRVLRSHSWGVFGGVAWSPDGELLASSGGDNAIRLWDPDTGNCVRVLRDPDHSDALFSGVAWSPDGKFLAGGSYMHGVQVWNMAERSRDWVGRAHPTIVRCVAWSPDSTRLASCGDDGAVCLWRAADGAMLQVLREHSANVAVVAWSPDGSLLASGGGGRSCGELFLWGSGDGELVRAFEGQPRAVSAVAWNARGDRLVTGDSEGGLRWWDAQKGECLVQRQGHRGAVHALRASPDGRLLASCGEDGTVKLWDMESAELVRTLRRDRPYERLNITGTRGLSPAQKASLLALGAFEEEAALPSDGAEREDEHQ